ncbi:MAG: tRNA (adenosine(37)-N6)-threonylcarbamoyltransferase complex transferase subunit TsaD [Candidatus Gottesmanbacteria bacterium]
MKILGIETSCDETSASIVEDGVNILSNVVASSQQMHIKTGGIIPERAAREQVKSIIPVIQEALSSLNPKPISPKGASSAYTLYPDIDAIAVTIGPGLIGSLLVGIETAKTLSYLWHKPIIPVNHLLAHVYANWLGIASLRGASTTKQSHKDNEIATATSWPRNDVAPQFPLIALIVSGGHTELIYMTGHGKYDWLGGTRDDAAGEAFDKIARLLELGYPGGPAIAQAATDYTLNPLALRAQALLIPYTLKLPRPMIDSDNFDFSFSGLKTAVLREMIKLKGMKQFTNGTINHLAYETQESITDVLVKKTIAAAREKNVRYILLAGGVAANSRLREKFQFAIHNSKFAMQIFVPPPSLCTDNAAAIASCAFFNNSPIEWQKIQAVPSLSL